MENIGSVFKSEKYEHIKEPTVNSIKDNPNTVNSNKTVSEKIDDFLNGLGVTPEAVAQKLSEDLGDAASLNYYIILAKENDPGRLMEALSYTKDAARCKRIRTKKAIYFQAILRKWGVQTRFKGLKRTKEFGRI